MLVTLSQFVRLGKDNNGNVMPLAKDRISCEARTVVGSFAALSVNTQFIRIATDTAIRVNFASGTTTTSDELIPANSTEYLAVNGGEIYSFLAA